MSRLTGRYGVTLLVFSILLLLTAVGCQTTKAQKNAEPADPTETPELPHPPDDEPSGESGPTPKPKKPRLSPGTAAP